MAAAHGSSLRPPSLRPRKSTPESIQTMQLSLDVPEKERLLENEEVNMGVTSPKSLGEISRRRSRTWTHRLCIGIASLLVFFLFLLFKLNTLTTIPNLHGAYFNGTHHFAPTVILISLDGFRKDYLDRQVTPHLVDFGNSGIQAEYMNPSFPSITFPNHWTLVTGLYPEAHGIVANEFYDPELKEQFIHKKPAISQQPKWWGGEPIWTTAASQGKKSAVIMWPGSAVPSHLPTYLVDYIRGTTAIDKMDTTLNWLDLPIESRPQMIAVYIPQIDQKGHGGGPDGPQMNRNLTQVDEAISHLMDGLKKRNLDALVDIVIVSDHGMAPTDKSRLIFYDDILSTESLRYLREREAWPMLNLRPVENAPSHIVDQVYEELHSYTQQVPEAHFRVYRREDVPARFHYSSTLRIAPIVTIPDVGYSFTTHDEFDPDTAPCYRPRGIHGYDNMAPEMRAIFMAKGPNVMRDYAPGTVLAPFFNIEVYGFLTRLLALDAAPNNGTLHGQFISVK